jgi:hypothetical protein
LDPCEEDSHCSGIRDPVAIIRGIFSGANGTQVTAQAHFGKDAEMGLWRGKGLNSPTFAELLKAKGFRLWNVHGFGKLDYSSDRLTAIRGYFAEAAE